MKSNYSIPALVRLAQKTLLIAFTTLVSLAHVYAAPVVFSGIDAGAGPADARPNSDGAAASFLVAGGALGTVTTIDFESVTLGNFSGSNAALDANVTASASAGAGASINNSFNDSINGYPTSPDQMIWYSAVGAANRSLSFGFATPIQAFGTYITGLGTAGGSTVNIDFNDGSAQNYQLNGSSSGGVLYWGFTSAGASISSISFIQDNASDAFGVDDISYVTIPEPASLVIVGLGLLGVACCRRERI